jgi:methylene-tetrahydromethanopterin dehydrogenase
MERPYILHLFTPERHASPSDVNMAADAGYHLVVPYAGVTLVDVPGLTCCAYRPFYRGPRRRVGDRHARCGSTGHGAAL